MKSILYFGATLMLAAGVYGFIDYKETQPQKGFTTLYAGKTAIPPANETAEINTTEMADPAVIGSLLKKIEMALHQNKEIKREKEINLDLFSRAPLGEIYVERVSILSDSVAKKK